MQQEVCQERGFCRTSHLRAISMSEPTIVCPSCKTEIKLTESLVAPIIESLRREFQQKIAQKEVDVAQRETRIKEQREALALAKDSIDDEVNSQTKDRAGEERRRRGQKSSARTWI